MKMKKTIKLIITRGNKNITLNKGKRITKPKNNN